MRKSILLGCIAYACHAAAQVTIAGTNAASSSGGGSGDLPTGVSLSYQTDQTTRSVTPSTTSFVAISGSASSAANGSSATITYHNGTASATVTLLVGNNTSTTVAANGTASSTSTSAQPTNTAPCNGYPEFCGRSFGNITHVAAHNSPFVRPGNAAANQVLDVTTQLNDGIRMLQFQTHLENGTMYLCHTSCDLLNAGTLEDYLTTVESWISSNPTDVISILMGNYDYVDPGNYTSAFEKSGIIKYVYTPDYAPMALTDWPTLGEMIIRNQRVVVMLDYQANQTAIPWLLDEFSNMSETPFSPTDRDFPCTVQRPPNQPPRVTRDKLLLINHNFNVDVTIAGLSLDIPAYPVLNETNSDLNVSGSASLAVGNCTSLWDRPPNFMLVDFYNIGNFNGSIFQVAADANNVTYNRKSCCGTDQRNISNLASMAQPARVVLYGALLLALSLLTL